MTTLHFLRSLITYPYRKIMRLIWSKEFAYFHMSSWIDRPLRLQGKANIYIGPHVGVHYKTWLAALPLTGQKDVRLEIKKGSVIGDFNHIYATHSIIIEHSVLTANHVYISDNLHGYQDINIPVMDQPIIQQRDVVIGEGSWIGENVCIIGASVGKHCVIGSNSVVTKDIPDYCVAVGIPAIVIKKYDHKLKQWIRC